MNIAKSKEILEALVGFDTVSRNSNLELIAWVEQYLDKLGVKHERVYDDTGKKSNLWATLGPALFVWSNVPARETTFIGVGVSVTLTAVVVTLLTTRWATTPQLARLTAADTKSTSSCLRTTRAQFSTTARTRRGGEKRTSCPSYSTARPPRWPLATRR